MLYELQIRLTNIFTDYICNVRERKVYSNVLENRGQIGLYIFFSGIFV